MKKIILLLVIFLIKSISIFSQNSYVLDISDETSYSISCGTTSADHWTVSKDSCYLSTPTLYVTGTGIQKVKYTIKINQSGNLESNDNSYIQYQIGGGSWVTDTILCGDGSTAVFSITDSLNLPGGQSIQFRIINQNDVNSESWQIKSGDIVINNVTIGNILPVELLTFTARVVDVSVKFEWSTATELNSDYFIVERSNDAGATFTEINRVKAAGISNETIFYDAYDESPKYGISFYRLKQVDYDGTSTTYDAIYVKIIENEIGYSFYPNPIGSNNAELNISKLKVGITLLTIYDESGLTVYEKTYCNETECIIPIDFDKFPNGFYIITIKNGIREFKTKIIKK